MNMLWLRACLAMIIALSLFGFLFVFLLIAKIVYDIHKETKIIKKCDEVLKKKQI